MSFFVQSNTSNRVNDYFVAQYSSPGVSSEADCLNFEIEQHIRHISLPVSVEKDIKKFCTLAATWKVETEFLSSTDQIVLNSSYQQIIGMGEKVIPYILIDLEKSKDHWFWALKSISGTDPVPTSDRGNIQKMAEAWLEWGKRNNYV